MQSRKLCLLLVLEIGPVATVLGAPDSNLVGNLGLEGANLVIDTVNRAGIASLNRECQPHLGIGSVLGSVTCCGSCGLSCECGSLSSQICRLVANPVQFGSQFAEFTVCGLNEVPEVTVEAFPCLAEAC